MPLALVPKASEPPGMAQSYRSAASSFRKDSPNLDLLRGLAVLFVLIDHTCEFHGVRSLGPFSITDLGGVGVSFFFVHTCLVLMMSMERLQGRLAGWRLAAAFYVRRLFRIYPLSILFIGAVLLAGIPAQRISEGLVHSQAVSARQIVSNLLLVQNLTYDHDIIGVLWTLPLEVQMYLFLPLLFLLLPKFRSWYWLIALWLIAVALAFVQPAVSARLNVAQYIPRFLPGVVAFALLDKVQARIPAFAWPCWLLALSAVSVLSWSGPVAWMLCLALGLSIPGFRPLSGKLLPGISAALAKYSYGIYLCHVPAIAIAFQLLGGLPMWERWSVFVALMSIVPVVSFHLVEQPFIRFGARVAARLSPKRQLERAAFAAGAA